MKGIEAFYLSDVSSTGKLNTDFIKEFFIRKSKELSESQQRVYLVLDNATKNRVKSIMNLSQSPRFNLIFIVPCTPILNFIENIFNILKRKVYSIPFHQRSVY